MAFLAAVLTAAAAQKTISVSVENGSGTARKAAPVVVGLADCGISVKSALVTLGGKEIPSQLDDLDGDGTFDELCFITDIDKNGKQAFTVRLDDSGTPRSYTPQVYAEMLLTNKKVKSNNKQNLYISSLTVDNGTNPYWMLHHHGPAFENDMVAYRIYFDHRQTVDIYGKYRKGLELKQTQFYPSKEQKAAGFGDDVLWVGETLGLGAGQSNRSLALSCAIGLAGERANGAVIASVRDAVPGERFSLRLADGDLACRVEGTEENGETAAAGG